MKRKNTKPKRLTNLPRRVDFYYKNEKQSCSRRIFQEIRHYQRTVELLTPRLPFQRLVMEILRCRKEDARIQSVAIQAIQVAAEFVLVELFGDSQKAASHARRKTIQPVDMKLVLDYKGEHLGV